MAFLSLAVTFLPLLGVIILLFVPKDNKDTIRWVATVTSLVTFVAALGVLAAFDTQATGMQMEVGPYNWVNAGAFNINFHIGIDGLSVLLIFLTGLLTPISIFGSWTAIQDRVKEYMIFFLLLEMGMMGVFVALDLFLFYIFWEFTLVPMYFLIGIWGGKRRLYAAIKFVLYTLAGSILMLLAIIWLGLNQGTFNVVEILANPVTSEVGRWLFLAFAAAFVIKIPMWPFHSWLPDAHVEAPTAGSVILAGVLLKLGSYGLARFNLGFFPEASHYFANAFAGLAVIGIIYGAIVSFPQRDVKKLVAYSSVSHMGFVILGLFALNQQGIQGAVMQMVNHGISTGALFLLVGFVYERRHTREMSEFGGLWKVMPLYGAMTLIVAFSSMGLPGLNGFMGEFPILLGSFGSEALSTPWYAIVGTLGVILAAVYILRMFQGMFLGPLNNPKNEVLSDLNWREIVVMVPLLIMIFWIGLFPQPFFDLMSGSVTDLVDTLNNVAVVALP